MYTWQRAHYVGGTVGITTQLFNRSATVYNSYNEANLTNANGVVLHQRDPRALTSASISDLQHGNANETILHQRYPNFVILANALRRLKKSK